MTEKKNGPASAATDSTVQAKEPITIIPHNPTNKQIVEIVREAFPDRFQGFGIPEASKGKHTEYTGLQYAEEIQTLISSRGLRRIDKRTLNNKLTVRCNDADYTRLQTAKKAYGPDCTTQEFILTALRNEFARIEGKRRGIV